MFGYTLKLKINIHVNETREYYLLRDFIMKKSHFNSS